MKLTKLYCNDKNFKPVIFKEGLNVIVGYGNKLSNNDSHNLGKTTIIKLIDYMLLKDINRDKDYFLTKKIDFFKNYQFFLEIECDNLSITIKRNVKDKKVSIKKHTSKYQNFISNDEWDLKDQTLNKAKKEIDKLLNYNIKNNFRKYLKFILRTQKDYEFKFKKNEVKDKDWKPFIMEMFGYPYKDYESLFKAKTEKEKIESQLSSYNNDYFEKLDEKKNFKEIYEKQINYLEKKVESYDYFEIDNSVNNNLVKKINSEISELNKKKYNLTFDIESIKKSLNTNMNTLDMEELQDIYKEVEIYFNNSLKKDYDSLIEFNKQISKERIDNLKHNLVKKSEQLKEINLILEQKNIEQKKYFEILKNNKLISKILSHNNELNKLKIEYARLTKELEVMKDNIGKNNELKQKELEINNIISKTSLDISENKNLLKETICDNFIDYTKNIFFDSEGRISIYSNKDGYPEMDIKLYSIGSGAVTAEDSGNNYNKHIKCCFDLAIIIGYKILEKKYFNFAFHDGSIEASDNKLKIEFLKLVSQLCKKYNIQYITTAIYDEISSEEIFNLIGKENIILKLDDSEDYSGTLFGKRF